MGLSKNDCGCIPRILAVDDTVFNIIPIRMLLKENFEIEVEDACNGAEAVQMFKDALAKPCGCIDRAYRLIFMDLQKSIPKINF